MSDTLKINRTALQRNLRDLNDVTKKLNADLASKNRILKTGLSDCQSCNNLLAKRGGSIVKLQS